MRCKTNRILGWESFYPKYRYNNNYAMQLADLTVYIQPYRYDILIVVKCLPVVSVKR